MDRISINQVAGQRGQCYEVDVYVNGHFEFVSDEIYNRAKAVQLAYDKRDEYEQPLDIYYWNGVIVTPSGQYIKPSNK